jgi:PAS domain S-box-containing protein
MLLSLFALEVVSLALFLALVIHSGYREVQDRIQVRLAYEISRLAAEASESMAEGNLSWLRFHVQEMGKDPAVEWVRISDASGNILYSSLGSGDAQRIPDADLAEIPRSMEERPHVFRFRDWSGEGVMPIYSSGALRGFVWIAAKRSWNLSLLQILYRATACFAVLWGLCSVLFVRQVSRRIIRPLIALRKGMRALAQESGARHFAPLEIPDNHEVGNLVRSFNHMVVTQLKQREGLDDTLTLLDSMLANAPIGLAFFDSRSRMVRINPVFARMCGIAMQRHTGRSLGEIFPPQTANAIDAQIRRVFTLEEAIHNLEISGQTLVREPRWTWLISAYPVFTGHQHLRWVGMVALDITENKQAQAALRRTEKLAATGRLAASVAHEVNNPLEALTNLLYLLRNFGELGPEAARYAEMAEHETRRIAEITQQTLRFFRQSTHPVRSEMTELPDAVLSLYQGRLQALNLQVERRYTGNLELYCYNGEMRQVFANLIGNAIDASKPAGRILVRARRSRDWREPEQQGVRFTIADTGSGMSREVRRQIFEAFFTTKESTGTGLGLWVSQEIVRKHGGQIRVRSRAEGGEAASGTVFTIFIPDNRELLVRLNQEREAAPEEEPPRGEAAREDANLIKSEP